MVLRFLGDRMRKVPVISQAVADCVRDEVTIDEAVIANIAHRMRQTNPVLAREIGLMMDGKNNGIIVFTASVVYRLIERQSEIDNERGFVISQEVADYVKQEITEGRMSIDDIAIRARQTNPVLIREIGLMMDGKNNHIIVFVASVVYRLIERQCEVENERGSLTNLPGRILMLKDMIVGRWKEGSLLCF